VVLLVESLLATRAAIASWMLQVLLLVESFAGHARCNCVLESCTCFFARLLWLPRQK